MWIGLTNGLAQYISDSLEKQGIAIMTGGYFSSLNIYDSYFRLNIGFQLTEQRRKLLKDICRCIQATKPTN